MQIGSSGETADGSHGVKSGSNSFSSVFDVIREGEILVNDDSEIFEF